MKKKKKKTVSNSRPGHAIYTRTLQLVSAVTFLQLVALSPFIHPSCRLTFDSQLVTERYSQPVHIQVQTTSAHTGTANQCTYRYSKPVHIPVQPTSAHTGTANQCTYRYSQPVHIRRGIKKFPDWTCRLECMYLIYVWAASPSK